MRTRYSLFKLTFILMLIGVATAAVCQAFTPEDRVQTTVTVHVRATPGGSDMGTAPAGTRGLVLAGPTQAYYQGTLYTWYQIQWDNGLTGWSIQDYLILVTVYNLNVASSNPSSGVSVIVGPNDILGHADGTTSFLRYFDTGTSVTLIAPTTASGNNFVKWTQNGSDYDTSRTITFSMLANYTMTAVFAPAPPPTHTLTVASANPNSGVSITANQPDNNGAYGGVTTFTRIFNQNTSASFNAPATAGGNAFQKWQRDGVDLTCSATASVTLDTDHTVTAIYVPSCSYSLSSGGANFGSNGGGGNVNVIAGSGCTWTADNGGASWISITSGSSGNGNGAVSYAVTSNTSANPRTANMTVAGLSYSVNQSGAPLGQSSLNVTPSTTTAFGGIQVGHTADRLFTVSNAGSATFSGAASVSAPFSVVSGGSYTLAPGQFQNVTVRYAPTAVENDTAYVMFSGGGGGQTREVTGSGFTDPTPASGLIAGIVTRADDHTPVNGVGITVLIPGGGLFDAPSTLSGPIGGQAGSYVISGLAPGTQYSVIATPPGQSLYLAELDGVSVVAGQSTTLNIALTPVPPQGQPSPTDIPVVLVRGWGPNHTWSDGESAYWATVSNALQKAGFQYIWDCNSPDSDIMGGNGQVINGENSIEFNAAQLEAYIYDKAVQYGNRTGNRLQKINIVAHSLGGLITRTAMHNLGNMFDYLDPNTGQLEPISVNKVIMLATPHCGSPFADWVINHKNSALIALGPCVIGDFDAKLKYLGDYCGVGNWDSTSELTVDHMTRDFNPTVGDWPSIVPLYLFSASGGPTSSNPGLQFGDQKIQERNRSFGPDEKTDDGAVTRASARGVYDDSAPNQPYYADVTGVSLNWIQNTSDLDLAGIPLDHLGLLTNDDVAAWVANTLLNPAATPTSFMNASLPKAQGATHAAATELPQPSAPMQQYESLTGDLTNGATTNASVISDGITTLVFELIASDTNVLFRLIDPSGAGLDANTPQSNSNVQYAVTATTSSLLLATYTIANPTGGMWTAVIDGSGMTTTQGAYNLIAFGDSYVRLIPQSGAFLSQGQDAVVTCELADLSTNPATPVQNASVTASVYLPDGSTNNLTLFDDGWHNDGAPNDGVYATVLGNVQRAGAYSVSYRAYGTDSLGQALQRVASSSFSVSTEDANLLGDPIYGTIDTNGDGVADFLTAKCWVSPKVAGTYIISCDLVDATETLRFSQSAQFTSDGSGPMQATLIFDLAQIRAAGGAGGFHVENLQLFEVGSSGTAWLDTYQGSSVTYIPPGAQAVTILYSFGWFSGPDGAYPNFKLVQGSDGNFYGTTIEGGTGNSCGAGCGTVFRISPGGSYTILHSFDDFPNDGSDPNTELVQGSDGNFYGTTPGGGAYYYGAAFRISPSGSYTNLYSFAGYPNDGARPIDGLVQGSDGNFYGTTTQGGTGTNCYPGLGFGCGTVFRISPSGSYTNLYSFGGSPSDGTTPTAGLVQGSDGNFYGTTINGGMSGGGTVFRISPSGSYTSLYSFGGSPSDGADPSGRLVQGSDGYFYGTTEYGGTTCYYCGTIFRISPSGIYTNLYSFLGYPTDGALPEAGLVQGSDGNFYGTATGGGMSGGGTVFRISPSGSYTNLYSFGGSPNDGATPTAGLVQGSDGSFYGTTINGGTSNSGTVFKLTVPLNPPPYPINQITGVNIAATSVVFNVVSIAGETYQLQYSADLTSGVWSNVPGVSVTNSIGALLTVTNFGGVAGSQGFYRFDITP